MRLDLGELGGSRVLAGSQLGQRMFRRLLEATSVEPSEPAPVFLDFQGVDVATASFLRESVLAFRDHVRSRRSTFYPVVANINAAVHEELLELTRARGGALMACVLAKDHTVTDTRLVGDLEPKQRMTLDLVTKKGETDAAELMRNHADEVRHVTAWNNRLAGLAALGLVMEVAQGRTKRYRPLLGGA